MVYLWDGNCFQHITCENEITCGKSHTYANLEFSTTEGGKYKIVSTKIKKQIIDSISSTTNYFYLRCKVKSPYIDMRGP